MHDYEGWGDGQFLRQCCVFKQVLVHDNEFSLENSGGGVGVKTKNDVDIELGGIVI